MRRQIANETIRQLVVLGIFLVRVGSVMIQIAVCDDLTIVGHAVTGLAIAAGLCRFRFRILGPDEAAFDPQAAVMIEDHEGPAARYVVGIVSLTLGVDPLHFGFKLPAPRIDIVGKFLGAFVLLGQAVVFRLRGVVGGGIVRRQFHRLRIGSTQAMAMRIIEIGLHPFPPFRLAQGGRRAFQLFQGQPVEQRHVLEIATAILGEQVAQDGAARVRVGLRPDKDRAAIRGGDIGLGEQAANGAGITVIRQPLIGGVLSGVILGDGEGHQLIQRQIAVAGRFAISLGDTAPSRKRCRTTCGVTPKRAAISSAPLPRSSASFLKASN